MDCYKVINDLEMIERENTITNKKQPTFKYSIHDDHVVIDGYRGKQKELVIPPYIEELPVTEIGERAFYSKDFLERVEFPETISVIGESAFSYCDNLKAVYFPKRKMQGLVICRSAFYNCDIRYPIIINSEFIAISYQAFACNFELEEIALISDKIMFVEDIFGACKSCKYVFLSKDADIRCFGYYSSDNNEVFNDMEQLSVLLMSSKCDFVTKDTFRGSPNTVVYCSAKSDVFNSLKSKKVVPVECVGYTELYDLFLKRYGSAGYDVRSEISKFISEKENDMVYERIVEKERSLIYNVFSDFLYVNWENGIKINAYKGDDEIVNIPETIEGLPVIVIGEKAFYENPYIEEVRMGDNVKIIQEEAFAGCRNLRLISFGSRLRDTISIESKAFYQSGIIKIELFAKEANIGYGAFATTTNLKEAVFFCEELALSDDVLSYSGCRTIFIERETKFSYQESGISFCFDSKFITNPGRIFSRMEELKYLILPDYAELSSNYLLNESEQVKVYVSEQSITYKSIRHKGYNVITFGYEEIHDRYKSKYSNVRI